MADSGNIRRKLVVSMNVTLDGYLSGPNCELDWHFRSWSAEMSGFLGEQLAKADTLLLGRTTYQAMAHYWGSRAEDLSSPVEDRALVALMHSHAKIVFSRHLTHMPWANTRRVEGDLFDTITSLRRQPGKNIMVYGSSKLVTGLIALDLVDEFQLWVHPVALGGGKPLFGHMDAPIHFTLAKVKTFRSGVVAFFYHNAVRAAV